MNKNAILVGLGLLVVLVFVGNAARFYRLDFVEQVSSILYDYRLRLTMPPMESRLPRSNAGGPK